MEALHELLELGEASLHGDDLCLDSSLVDGTGVFLLLHPPVGSSSEIVSR